jgi:hypothetical protein
MITVKLKKKKKDQTRITKVPKYEEQLSCLVCYLFDEDTWHSNISPCSSSSRNERSNDHTDDQGTGINRDTQHTNATNTTTATDSAQKK